MPRSKRNKLVSLTATAKKPGRENNERLFAQIQECVDTYPHIFVFSVDNMRNTHLKTVRSELSDSRMFFGKTKVMAKALGTTDTTEQRTNLRHLTPHLAGSVGLLFTPRSAPEILEYFSAFVKTDFARQGHVAPETFVVPGGIVYETGGMVAESDDVPLPHSLETVVRGHGMPTKLNKGKVYLEQEFVVCQEGKKLDSRQAALLKLFGRETAEFRVKVVAWWGKETESVEVIDADEEETEE